MSRNISIIKNQTKVNSVYVDVDKFKKILEKNKLYENLKEFVKNCPIQCKMIPINMSQVKPEKFYSMIKNILLKIKLENEYLILFVLVNEKILTIEGHHKTTKSKMIYNNLEKYLFNHFIWNGSDYKYIIITEDNVKAPSFIKTQKLYSIFISLVKKQKIVDIEHLVQVCKFETHTVNYEDNRIDIYVFDLHKETARNLCIEMMKKINKDLTIVKKCIFAQ